MTGMCSEVGVGGSRSNAGVGKSSRDVAGGATWAMEKEEMADRSNRKSNGKWPKVKVCFSDKPFKVAIMMEAIR